MKKTIYCTLDTETVGGFQKPHIWNLGGIIHDKRGNELTQFNFIIRHEAVKLRNPKEWGYGKYDHITIDPCTKFFDTEGQAIIAFLALLDKYNVTVLLAYNAQFDLARTPLRFVTQSYQFIDTWLLALQTICLQKSYIEWVEKHHLFTPKGYYKTDAETVYGYCLQEVNYQEKHLALEDSKIEKEIFIRCMRQHKHFTRNQHKIKAVGRIAPAQMRK